jgi:hypothetical protein
LSLRQVRVVLIGGRGFSVVVSVILLGAIVVVSVELTAELFEAEARVFDVGIAVVLVAVEGVVVKLTEVELFVLAEGLAVLVELEPAGTDGVGVTVVEELIVRPGVLLMLGKVGVVTEELMLEAAIGGIVGVLTVVRTEDELSKALVEFIRSGLGVVAFVVVPGALALVGGVIPSSPCLLHCEPWQFLPHGLPTSANDLRTNLSGMKSS